MLTPGLINNIALFVNARLSETKYSLFGYNVKSFDLSQTNKINFNVITYFYAEVKYSLSGPHLQIKLDIYIICHIGAILLFSRFLLGLVAVHRLLWNQSNFISKIVALVWSSNSANSIPTSYISCWSPMDCFTNGKISMISLGLKHVPVLPIAVVFVDG
jgi:hypothetical protein